jgi:hypothetical protein
MRRGHRSSKSCVAHAHAAGSGPRGGSLLIFALIGIGIGL